MDAELDIRFIEVGILTPRSRSFQSLLRHRNRSHRLLRRRLIRRSPLH
jgi:hypothetical protein